MAEPQRIKGVLAPAGFDVFAGSEAFLLATMRHGGAGCISATANINPTAIHKLYREWRNPDADTQQEALNLLRNTVATYPMIAALKQVIAHITRAGTDYGARERTLEEKTADVMRQLPRGEVKVVFDPRTNSVNIVTL